jgi:carbamoyl-phosphate synthase large subunit
VGERRNVLITSAGRRTFLVQAFREALSGAGHVIAADLDALAPALHLADRAVRLPRFDDAGYGDLLVDIVCRSDVRAVIPTIDTELPKLVELSGAFRSCGAVAVVSTGAFIATTTDKWLTAKAFRSEGVACPQTWLPQELEDASLPDRVVVKPRFGSASQGILRVNREHIANAVALTQDPIVQAELSGREVTVDALFDLNGRLIHYVPRVRLKAIGGESVEGVTISRDELGPWIDDALLACGRLGARGPVTLQCFVESTGPELTEINPRFSGGFPLTYRAGGWYPQWLLKELEGSTVHSRIGEYEVGLRMTRHYVEIFPSDSPW